MNEELKNKFKNGMIPDEVAFGQLIDEATKEVDLSDYATKEEIPVVPDVSNFITLEDIPETDLSEYAKVSDIPSLDGLLNQTAAETLYVRKDALPNFEEYAKKTDIPEPQDLSHLATKSEIPDVSSFITLEEIPPTDLSAYAKVSDIPSLEGLLSEVNAENLYVRKDSLVIVLADYAKKSEIPDVSEFITLNEVPEVDLSGYATKEEANSRKVDFLRDSNSSPPPKSGNSSKGYKIIHKISDTNMRVFQPVSSGGLFYQFESHSGGSGYGVDYELMRLTKVMDMPSVMVYKDISKPDVGTLEKVWQFDEGGSVENTITMHPHVTTVPNPNRMTGQQSTGLQAFSLAPEASVTYKMYSQYSTSANIAFFSRSGWTEAEEFEVLLDDKPVSTGIVNSDPKHVLQVFKFQTPRHQKNFNLTIKNKSTTKNLFLTAINLFDLKNYNGAYVDNYVALGRSQTYPFIDNKGASEYAFKNLETGKQFGSFHGGEIRDSFKVIHKPLPQSVSEGADLDSGSTRPVKVDWNDIPVGRFYITSDFSFQQETTLIERASMYIDTNLNIDGTIHYDMSYNILEGQEPIPLEDMWTSLTCTSPYFNKVKLPQLLRLDPNPENATKTHFPLVSSTNKVIQTTEDETQEVHIRYTRFNEGYIGTNPTELTVSDQPQYRKIYYAPIRLNKDSDVKPTSVQFSKGIDFYTYK